MVVGGERSKTWEEEVEEKSLPSFLYNVAYTNVCVYLSVHASVCARLASWFFFCVFRVSTVSFLRVFMYS